MTPHPNGTTPNSHVRRVCAALDAVSHALYAPADGHA